MTPWAQRSHEERTLLNPGFCANLLWHGALGHMAENRAAMPLEESFLVLPFVLHRETREALPRNTRTSLPVWLNENPLARSQVVTRARALVPFTKEALIFAGVRGFIALNDTRLHADANWGAAVNRVLKESSAEVNLCAKRAFFLGKWFAKTGSATTVLAIMGARP